MKTFSCCCGNTVYFENTDCLRCDRKLGFLPDRLTLSALEPAGDQLWRPAGAADGLLYRACRNGIDHDACNWMVPADEPEDYCLACRLNQVIPNLDKPGNRALWIRIEQTKRRLIYDLRRLHLPVFPKTSNPNNGLAFAFMEDNPEGLEFAHQHQGSQIMTGHANGLITINIAEADDAERERRRQQMNEQQRTLLGHFRHESGHYYWDRLIANGAMLKPVRALFGDERQDYASALEDYYNDGPSENWWNTHVSAYASAHPWEDWAESWAHWLQISDTVETAAAIGLADPAVVDLPARQKIASWVELALKINLINRSLDQPDPYPYVLTPPVIDKLCLIDRVIASSGFSP